MKELIKKLFKKKKETSKQRWDRIQQYHNEI